MYCQRYNEQWLLFRLISHCASRFKLDLLRWSPHPIVKTKTNMSLTIASTKMYRIYSDKSNNSGLELTLINEFNIK